MNKSHYLHVRLTPEQYKALIERSKAAGLSRSDYARVLLLLPTRVLSATATADVAATSAAEPSEGHATGFDATVFDDASTQSPLICVLEPNTFHEMKNLVRRYGNLHNQATRALNIIALSVKSGNLMYEADAKELLSEARDYLRKSLTLMDKVEAAILSAECKCDLYMRGRG